MKVPILLYHSLFERSYNREKYSISKEEFKSHIDYLSKHGFQSILIEDIFKKNNMQANGKYISITFDDGNESDYFIAFPLLKKMGFVATFFITVGWVGKKNYLSWNNLKEMQRNGMSIQSHGLTHSILSDLKDKDLYNELNESKRIIELNLNSSVNILSIPGDFFSKKVLNMARKVGYECVCTSTPKLNDAILKKHKFATLGRIVITRKTSFTEFKKIAHGNTEYLRFKKMIYYLKRSIGKTIGAQNYYKIWKRLFSNT